MRYPKLRPFTQIPGTCVWIPYTGYYAQIFPTLVILFNLEGKEHLRISLEGFFEDFSLFQDLDKGVVEVFLNKGKETKSYRLGIQKGLELYVTAGPLTLQIGALQHTLQSKTRLPLLPIKSYQRRSGRLYLGLEKKLNFTSLLERDDLCEILPLWYQAGNFLGKKGKESLFESLESISSHSLKTLFKVGFEGLFVPQKTDVHHWGFPYKLKNAELLLTEGRKVIESLFFKEEKGHLFFLPTLFKEFHTGKAFEWETSFGKVDFDWSKKELKKITLKPEKETLIHLHVPHFKTARFCLERNEKGERRPFQEPLLVKPNQMIFLDQFTR